MSSRSFSGEAAIAGIGATEFSKQSGRSELRLACEAISAALADAGIRPTEVDGLCTYSLDHNLESEVFRNIGGRELKFFSRVHYGGGAACATVLQAALAVQAGLAEVVVVYRAMNERSEYRFGSGLMPAAHVVTAELVQFGWYMPYGLMTPAAWVAMLARRYMHQSGATSEDFGRVAVTMREHAARNPAAWFHGKPITLAEHQASRPICEPLRLLDCCQESDGGVALVVTSTDRARRLAQPPAVIAAAAQGSAGDQQQMTSYYRADIARLTEVELVARQLWAQSGLTPADIQTAVIYDHFTPLVLMQLEAYGFCDRGAAPQFVREGQIGLGGRLPVNTHGGQLGEGYIHGMNGIAEAVRQIRGTSCNPVAAVEHVLVTAGTGVPTSALILGRDARR
ncbi:MAG: lipid-transfer protein [Gammaproteobacteria bacterium]|nr:MAG: lipid-transfer protein [Gammaproteobacteria bacterium]